MQAGPGRGALMPAPVGWMGAGLLTLVLASAVRATAAGTVRVDETIIYGLARAVVAGLVAFGASALAAGYLAGFSSIRQARAPWSWRRLVGLALGLQVLASFMLPLTSNDVFSNILYGHLEAYRGIHAATVTPDAMRTDPLFAWVGETWNDIPCVYGPFLIAHLRLASWLSGGTLVAGLVVHKILLLAVSAVWIGLCAAWARGLEDEKARRPAVWLLAFNPIWLFEVTGQAHNDGIVVVLVMTAVLAYRRGWLLSSSALLGLATAGKYFAVVPFGCLMLWSVLHGGRLPRRLRAVTLATLVFGGTIALCYAPSWEGWQTISYPWSFIAKPRYLGSLLQIAYACGYPWGRDAMLEAAMWTTRAFSAGLVALTVVWIRGWRTRVEDAWVPWETAFRFMLLYIVLLTGWFMPWYITWLLPLVATVRDRRWWAVVVVYSCSALAYQAIDFPLDVVLPANVTRVLRPLLLQGPVVVLLVRLAFGWPVVPPASRHRVVRWLAAASG